MDQLPFLVGLKAPVGSTGLPLWVVVGGGVVLFLVLLAATRKKKVAIIKTRLG